MKTRKSKTTIEIAMFLKFLEFSSKHPPTHYVTYPLELESNNPENLKVKVEVIYRNRRIPPRTSSARAVLLRFIEDIGGKHIVMTLEATICRENGTTFNSRLSIKKDAHWKWTWSLRAERSVTACLNKRSSGTVRQQD